MVRISDVHAVYENSYNIIVEFFESPPSRPYFKKIRVSFRDAKQV